MPRGILVDGSIIEMVNGKRVQTFWGCDLEYLEEEVGLRAGDVVAFSLEHGTLDTAGYIRKASSPTADEIALSRAVKQQRRREATSST